MPHGLQIHALWTLGAFSHQPGREGPPWRQNLVCFVGSLAVAWSVVNFAWQDFQFSYELSIEGTTLQYSKKLRYGGYLPTGAVDLGVAVSRKSLGQPQPGEERQALDLNKTTSAAIRKQPYRGYSAFRQPIIIFSGLGVAVLAMVWKDPGHQWTGADWGLALGSLVLTCFLVDWTLARLFPHRTLMLHGIDGRVFARIDVNAMPPEDKKKLLDRLNKATHSTG